MSDGAEDETARARARVGQVLKEKWTLDKLLGVGGMGAVYAATHRNKKRGAVKILHPEMSAEASIRQRFLREGYVANSVGHRGAVEVFDDDIAQDGAAYLVMELLEGESIEARWERKGRKLPVLEVLALVDQLLETLNEAHSKDIVHRDLKPENLFLQKGGVLKVLDFGIARLREAGKTATATQTGSAMGTPAFMAPEQARGRWEDVDGRTDLWAVGASIFTLISGKYVHGTGTVNEILARAITQTPASFGTAEPAADPALVAFVDKAMAYATQDRFQTALEMQGALRELYHALDGRHEMRAVQPSVPDGVGAPVSDGVQVIEATRSGSPSGAGTPSSSGTPSSGGVAVAASSATLTTGRPMVTSTGSISMPKSGLPKWLPVAAVGGVAAVIGLVLLLAGGESQKSATGAAPVGVVEQPASAAPALPTLAAEAPSPPQQTVDLQSLPTLTSATPAAAASAPSRQAQAQPSKPPASLLDAINPNKAAPPASPAAPPPPPATKPAPAKPADLFKKRQ